MPDLVTAEIKLRNGDSNLLECLSSAKHLSLCLTPYLNEYLTSEFNHLVSLEICIICFLDWFCPILELSPILRVLKLRQIHCSSNRDLENQWENPCCVPECLISSLETVEWVGYQGRRVEREMAIYILENANCLKTMTITPSISTSWEEKTKMLIELTSTSRCSLKPGFSFSFIPGSSI
ncbi:putative FBD-associated F-box protein At5g56440 [Eutrema salsugineum]|nr:putative FBD-associated F-box protein At5g56440 [Eutrema salsugineum]